MAFGPLRVPVLPIGVMSGVDVTLAQCGAPEPVSEPRGITTSQLIHFVGNVGEYVLLLCWKPKNKKYTRTPRASHTRTPTDHCAISAPIRRQGIWQARQLLTDAADRRRTRAPTRARRRTSSSRCRRATLPAAAWSPARCRARIVKTKNLLQTAHKKYSPFIGGSDCIS